MTLAVAYPVVLNQVWFAPREHLTVSRGILVNHDMGAGVPGPSG